MLHDLAFLIQIIIAVLQVYGSWWENKARIDDEQDGPCIAGAAAGPWRAVPELPAHWVEMHRLQFSWLYFFIYIFGSDRLIWQDINTLSVAVYTESHYN